MLFGRQRIDHERVDLALHGIAERVVNQAVPLDERLPLEAGGHDSHFEVIARAFQVCRINLSVGNSRL